MGDSGVRGFAFFWDQQHLPGSDKSSALPWPHSGPKYNWLGQDQHPPGRHCALRSLLGEEAVLASAGSFSLMLGAAAAGNGHVALSVGDRQEQPVQLPLQAPGFAQQAVRVTGILSLGCEVWWGIPWGYSKGLIPKLCICTLPFGEKPGDAMEGLSSCTDPGTLVVIWGPIVMLLRVWFSHYGSTLQQQFSVLVAEAPLPSREHCRAPSVCIPCSSQCLESAPSTLSCE